MDTAAMAERFLEIPASVRAAHARDEGRMDPLTGLSNRRHLRAVLERHLATAAPDSIAVVFIDLDRLKLVNDTFGHEAGDRVLRVVGGRLRGFASDLDLVVRLGGDEFAACIVDIPSIDAVQALCERILAAVAEPIVISEREFSLTASIGIATNTRSAKPADLLSRADEAMYDAKRAGRNQANVFTRRRGSGPSAIEISLHQLGRASGIETQFQVIEDVDRRPVGVEALARWRQGDALLQPDEFVPLAERSGAMAAITQAVLDQALAVASTVGDGIPVHVNISQSALGDGRLAAMIERSCREAGVSPARLCLEVTETSFAPDAHAAAGRLCELRSLGCTVAIDDFGTGYGSLVLIRDVAVDSVKIDKSFIDEIVGSAAVQAIVRSVVTLAHGIGATVVAEGVDDDAKRRMSFDLGCDAIQGNLVGQPESAAEITARLGTTRRARHRDRR